MSNSREVVRAQQQDDEVDLLEVFRVLWRGKWLIGGLTAVTTIVAVVIILMLPTIYRAENAFPGRHPIDQGGTSSSMPDGSGGLTEEAFSEGTIFLRVSILPSKFLTIDKRLCLAV